MHSESALHQNPRDGFVLRPVSPYGLHPDEVTIAEVLKEVDYATAIIGKWHLGDQLPFLPTRQGFDLFYGVPYSDDMTEATGMRLAERFDGHLWPPLPLMENERVVEAPVDRTTLTKRYTERAIEFIEAHHDQPFFLYMPQAMPGSTARPFSSEAFSGKSENGPWGDSIEELDWSIGQILDTLEQLEIGRQTLVVWTSDNGAPIRPQHGDYSRGRNEPLHGPGYSTAEGAFRVPTIMWWPETIPAESECDAMATTMDLLPTFARLAGNQSVHDLRLDGYDIFALMNGDQETEAPYSSFFYYQADQLQAVRSGPWKLFVTLDDFSRHPHFQRGQSDQPLLFNVVDDIGSEHNVAEVHPEIVEHLLELANLAREDLGDVGRAGRGQRQPGRIAQPTARRLSNVN